MTSGTSFVYVSSQCLVSHKDAKPAEARRQGHNQVLFQGSSRNGEQFCINLEYRYRHTRQHNCPSLNDICVASKDITKAQ